MPSPIVTVDGSSTVNGVNVSDNTPITIALADVAGVSNWSVECIGTDDGTSAVDVNADMTVNQGTKVAVIGSGLQQGTTAIFRSVVNNGRDVNGTVQDSYATTFGVYCLTSNGFRVVAVNETTEGSATFGWVASFNAVVRAMP